MSVQSALAYAWGQCTWFVEKYTPWLGTIPGDAWQWAQNAANLGYSVTGLPGKGPGVPQVGSVAVFQRGQFGADKSAGHVATVKAINPQTGAVTLSQANWPEGTIGGITTFTAAQARQLAFIAPKGSKAPTGTGVAPVDFNVGPITVPFPTLPNPGDVAGAVVAAPGSFLNSILTAFGTGIVDLFERAVLMMVGIVLVLMGVKILFAADAQLPQAAEEAAVPAVAVAEGGEKVASAVTGSSSRSGMRSSSTSFKRSTKTARGKTSKPRPKAKKAEAALKDAAVAE